MITRMIITMAIIMAMGSTGMTMDTGIITGTDMAMAITIMRPPISAVPLPSAYCSTAVSSSSKAFTA